MDAGVVSLDQIEVVAFDVDIVEVQLVSDLSAEQNAELRVRALRVEDKIVCDVEMAARSAETNVIRRFTELDDTVAVERGAVIPIVIRRDSGISEIDAVAERSTDGVVGDNVTDRGIPVRRSDAHSFVDRLYSRVPTGGMA